MQNQKNNQQNEEQTVKQQKIRTIKKEFLISENGFDYFVNQFQNNTQLAITQDSDEFIDLLLEEFHKWWKQSKIYMPFDKFCIKIDKVQSKTEMINSMLGTVQKYYQESGNLQYKRKHVAEFEDEQNDLEDHYDFDILDLRGDNQYQNLSALSESDGDYIPDQNENSESNDISQDDI